LIAKLRHALRALSSPNLRLYFFGQGISLIGTWITGVASSWLVYRLTNSEFLLGLVLFSGQFPTALLGPFAGVLVDRVDRRKLMLVTQALSMLQSLLLAALTLSGQVTVAQIIALNIFQALVNGFDAPARQSLLSELVQDRRDLSNAIALNAAMFHGSRLVGPAIAGVLVAISGEGLCFLIDALSYAAVLISLTLIKNYSAYIPQPSKSLFSAMAEGVTYSLHSKPIRYILGVISLFSLFGTPQISLLPVFARDILHGGPELFGALMAISGLGAFVGALFLAARDRDTDLGRVIAPMPACAGVGLALLAFAPSVWVASIGVFITGFSMVTLMAGCNAVLQSIVDDDKRARVMSFYSTAFFGMMPLGGLIAGAIAQAVSAPFTVACGALVNIVITFIYLPRLRTVHRKGENTAQLGPN
jgi:MFS family permease